MLFECFGQIRTFYSNVNNDVKKIKSSRILSWSLRKHVRNGKAEDEPSVDLAVRRDVCELLQANDRQDRESQESGLENQRVCRLQRERQGSNEECVQKLFVVKRVLRGEEGQNKSCNGERRAEAAADSEEISNNREIELCRDRHFFIKYGHL